MTRRLFGLIVLAGVIGTDTTTAQDKAKDTEQEKARVKEPARPEKLDIQIRYRIRADRDERIRQYRVLVKHLADLGFVDARKDDPDHELDILDPTHERFTGTIPSAKVMDVFQDPRVLNILFAPVGYMFPDVPEKPVPIRVALRDGLLPSVQQQLFLQTLAQLDLLGFKEALGYDTRGYTQIKGTIPYKRLDRLMKDLRSEPSGWFLPDNPPDLLPRPLAERNPIRWVEVMPAAEPPPPFTPEVVLPIRAILTPDLRALLMNPAAKETPVRVIVLFANPIEDKLEDLRNKLSGSYGPTPKRNADGTAVKGADGLPAFTDGAALDGASGNLVSIRFDRPADAERFSLEPGVLSVRLPRQATETITPLPADWKAASAKDVLAASGMQTMHRLGYTGSGVKIIVIGTDFTDADKLIGTSLPKKTRLLDLTTELNPEIVPSPPEPNRAGNGTAAAKAVALAAPDAELVLVRIDPGAIFQLFGILRMVRGEATYTDAMRSRLVDINTKTEALTRRKEAALTEYRLAFEDLSDDDVTKARRSKAKAALDALIAEQTELAKRTQRFNVFQKDILAALSGARVVVNTLEWESGFPLDAMSQLSRTLEQLAISLPRRVQRPGDPASAEKPQIVWVQASSGSGAAVWGGPFLDANRNGIMEFAPATQPLPLSNWSPEMNFLGVHSATGETTPELAKGTKIRVTMQWREPRDPNVPNLGRPTYPVILHVWRQLDPNGDKQPSDEMSEVARSVGGPYPIQLTPTFVVYEQILEFTIPVTGRYALVVGTGNQPEALLPALRREFEVYPRIVLETLSGKPGEGQAVFRSFVTPNAGVGIPADSTGAITVGVPVPGELHGGGAGLTLRGKPDLFGPDTVDVSGRVRGSGVAAGYVGGMAASLVQAGAAGSNVFESARFDPGKMAIVPESWMKFLKTAPKPEK
jgi:hypothetical protein